jgi:hypothetical protein
VANLRLKPVEAALKPPGISVQRAASPAEAARQIRAAFPRGRRLHAAAAVVGSTNDALIQSAGFAIIHVPSSALPSHYRIIHPEGAAGFTDENLARLAAAFTETAGH